MAKHDVYGGKPGEWRGGMWFPDPEPVQAKLNDEEIIRDIYRSLVQLARDNLDNSKYVNYLIKNLNDDILPAVIGAQEAV